MRPSAQQRHRVRSRPAADVGDHRNLAEIEPAGDVCRIAASARETIHRADESFGLSGTALKHIRRARRSAGANGLFEMRPGFKDRFVEQNQTAKIFAGRAQQIAPRRIVERVAAGALVEQSERNHRGGYQSRRWAIGGDCGGESGLVERRALEHIENFQLERGLDCARFGVTGGQRGKFGEIHRDACQCTKSWVTYVLPSADWAIPAPVSVNLSEMMLARCSGLLSHPFIARRGTPAESASSSM